MSAEVDTLYAGSSILVPPSAHPVISHIAFHHPLI
jgi:hypothetical protein